jgi:uncharacterized protein
MPSPSSPIRCRILCKLPCTTVALLLALTIILTIAPALAADARPIVGDWEGTLDPGAQPKKRIVVHITAAQDGSLNGTIDYPDDDSSGVMITAITYKEPVLHFESTAGLVAYDGAMSTDKSQIGGTWKQGGKSLDLVLKRTP